jgi:hypothetical protein
MGDDIAAAQERLKEFTKHSPPIKYEDDGKIVPPPIAVFFDNDAANFRGFENFPRVLTVKIPETSHDAPNVPFDTFVGPLGLEGNTYYQLLTESKFLGDAYDSASGVTREILNDVYDAWVESNPSIKYFIFDWDRTLTQFEGIVLRASKFYRDHPLGGTDDCSYEDMLIYLFGGGARLGKMREWIGFLQGEGIEIIILTNNGSCFDVDAAGKESIHKGFKAVVDTLAPGCRIICSGNPSGHAGRKDVAMWALMPRAITGGRRKSKKKMRTTKRGAKSKSRRRRSTFRRAGSL